MSEFNEEIDKKLKECVEKSKIRYETELELARLFFIQKTVSGSIELKHFYDEANETELADLSEELLILSMQMDPEEWFCGFREEIKTCEAEVDKMNQKLLEDQGDSDESQNADMNNSALIQSDMNELKWFEAKLRRRKAEYTDEDALRTLNGKQNDAVKLFIPLFADPIWRFVLQDLPVFYALSKTKLRAPKTKNSVGKIQINIQNLPERYLFSPSSIIRLKDKENSFHVKIIPADSSQGIDEISLPLLCPIGILESYQRFSMNREVENVHTFTYYTRLLNNQKNLQPEFFSEADAWFFEMCSGLSLVTELTAFFCGLEKRYPDSYWDSSENSNRRESGRLLDWDKCCIKVLLEVLTAKGPEIFACPAVFWRINTILKALWDTEYSCALLKNSYSNMKDIKTYPLKQFSDWVSYAQTKFDNSFYREPCHIASSFNEERTQMEEIISTILYGKRESFYDNRYIAKEYDDDHLRERINEIIHLVNMAANEVLLGGRKLDDFPAMYPKTINVNNMYRQNMSESEVLAKVKLQLHEVLELRYCDIYEPPNNKRHFYFYGVTHFSNPVIEGLVSKAEKKTIKVNTSTGKKCLESNKSRNNEERMFERIHKAIYPDNPTILYDTLTKVLTAEETPKPKQGEQQ